MRKPITTTTIEWCSHSCNPVRGQCPHYGNSAICTLKACYAEAIRTQYGNPSELSWHPNVLEDMEARKKAMTCFVGSVMDLGAEAISEHWFKQIMASGRRMEGQGKTLIYLTKNPGAFYKEEFLDHMWLGTTINHSNQTTRAYQVGGTGGATGISERNCFISFEPLLEDVSGSFPAVDRIRDNVRGFIIGGQTKPDIMPKLEWVMELIALANELGICVFLKDNLKDLPGIDIMQYRELPWETNK